MAGDTKEQAEKDFPVVERFRADADGRVELVEDVEQGIRLVKRTYYEDKREIFELLSELRSPYLAQIRAVFFDTDTIVLEEYIEGETLHNYLEHSVVSSRQASGFVLELLYAVSVIHKLGIVHRDIKPENILIDKSGHLHLIDFGIARIYRPGKENDTQLLGTVGYAAPEQFGYAQSDFRSDIYAIGMTCRDINRVCGKNRLLQKIEHRCTRMDPSERYSDTEAILREFRKRKLTVWGRAVLAAIFVIVVGIGGCLFCRQKGVEEMRGDLLTVPDENRLFVGQEYAPCLILAQDSEKRTKFSPGEKEQTLEVQANLAAQGLSLTITDASGSKYEFLLSNQYEIPEDYTDTSLCAEVLFFDTDHDGMDEIWVAVSDRKSVTLVNGEMAVNQNYMAGWCVFREKGGKFVLADGQLFTEGSFEIGTVNPDGIWQEAEFEAFVLEDGSLAEVLY